MRNSIAFSSFVMLIACAMVRADVPATAPADAGYTLSPPHVATLRPCTYFFTSTQTTYDKLRALAPQLTGDLSMTMANAGVAPIGGPIFVYKNTSGMDQPFTLELGYPVANATQPAGQYQVAKLDGMRSMTAVFTGPVSKISAAYQQIFAQIAAAGEVPSTERRERYLYWEGADSPNNVILIEIGLQGAGGGM